MTKNPQALTVLPHRRRPPPQTPHRLQRMRMRRTLRSRRGCKGGQRTRVTRALRARSQHLLSDVNISLVGLDQAFDASICRWSHLRAFFWTLISRTTLILLWQILVLHNISLTKTASSNWFHLLSVGFMHFMGFSLVTYTLLHDIDGKTKTKWKHWKCCLM